VSVLALATAPPSEEDGRRFPAEEGTKVTRRAPTHTSARRALALLGVLAFAPLLAGCADGGAENVQGSWVLSSGSDARGPFIEAASPVTLEVEGLDFAGRSPCNSYFGSITASPSRMSFEELTTTEAACADPEQMDLEARYYAALTATEHATRSSRELVLTGRGIELVFEAASGG
jgi:heat shock protein HslJ